MSENAILAKLTALGLVDPLALEPFGHCRDRRDIGALRCRRSGIVVLSRTDHVTFSYYQDKEGELDAVEIDGVAVIPPPLDDDLRRSAEVGSLVAGAHWLDFGCGPGGILDVLAPRAASTAAVEPNADYAARLTARGHTVHGSIDHIGDARYDVITMFHVLEHLIDPIAVLAKLKAHLRPGGRIVIEVPHARDALLTLYDCVPFRDFTLWSEHLILHTRESLVAFVRAAGLGGCVVKGVQRYPVANHLCWLRHGRPAGQKLWHLLDTPALADVYQSALQSMDMTDTLLAITDA